MKLNYKYDDGLEFLQYCSDEELKFFVELYKKEAKTTESLTSEGKYKKYYPYHHKYWELIAAELQYFGGNTVLNIKRGHGILYKEIICDICTKEFISYDKKADVAQIEKVFIFEYLKKSISKMNPDELNNFKNNFKLTDIDEIKLLNELRKKLFSDNNFFQSISTNLVNSLGKNIIKQGAKVVLPFVAQQLLKKTVGLPIGVVLTAKDITDPAFRVTLPSVIYVSYLRNKYQDKDLEFRHRFYPLKGCILRTELVAGAADHSGIYLGDEKIIEIVEKNNEGCVVITNIHDFVYSSSVRTGTTIYIAVDRLSKDIIFNKDIIDRASRCVGRKNKYQLLKNNCHSFVHKCIINDNFDKITQVWKFVDLTESISANLNNGRTVDWVVCDINPVEHKKVKKWKIEDEVVCRN